MLQWVGPLGPFGAQVGFQPIQLLARLFLKRTPIELRCRLHSRTQKGVGDACMYLDKKEVSIYSFI